MKRMTPDEAIAQAHLIARQEKARADKWENAARSLADVIAIGKPTEMDGFIKLVESEVKQAMDEV